MKTVFIAEKAQVARQIKSYYQSIWGDNLTESFESDLKITTLMNGNDQIVLAPLSGHLIKLKQMKEYEDGKNLSWRSVVLSKKPFIPSEFEFRIREHDAIRKEVPNYPQRVIQNIEKLIIDADEIINAGDADEEGQYLVDEVIDYLKRHDRFKSQANYSRIFIHSTDVKGIKRAIEKRIPNERVYSRGLAAKGRSIADWIWGANMTLLATELLGHEFATTTQDGKKKKAMLSVGRVQTPVLNLIYEREQLIKNFKEQVFYNVEATMEKTGYEPFKGDLNLKHPVLFEELERANELDLDGRLISKDRANFLCQRYKINGEYKIGNVEKNNSKEFAPLPLSIEELQKRMSRMYKKSAADTLAAAQNLYMAQLITYPRNNGARYLPTELQGDVPDVFEALEKLNDDLFNSGLEISDKTNLKSKAWNDSKVGSHYAIIPTSEITPDKLKNLNVTERQVYNEVVKFYLYMFMLPAQKSAIKATVFHDQDNKLEINVSLSTYLELGYRQAFNEFDNKLSKSLPDLNDGDTVLLNSINTREGKTTPPRLFTSDTLIDAMSKAYKFVNDKGLARRLSGDIDHLSEEEQEFEVSVGIGTSATRAEILNKLVKTQYVEVDTKDQYTTTPRAVYLLGNLPNFLKEVDTTARWQLELDEVRQDKMSLNDFIDSQIKELRDIFAESSENLGNAIGYFNQKVYRFNEVTTENIKECPSCKVGMMNKVEWDDEVGVHKTEHVCKNQNCGYREDVYQNVAYPKFVKFKSPHQCPSCRKGELYFNSGFSFKTLKPYSFLQCENDKCGKMFSADENMNIVIKKGGTPTEHKCDVCGSHLNELKGESKETGKPYHFFVCSSSSCDSKYSANKEGLPVYAAKTPCPNCGGKLYRLTGISQKGNPYDFFSCSNQKCKVTASPNANGEPVFNLCSENCFKCGSKMSHTEIPYKDKTTGENKVMHKARCLSADCAAEYFVDFNTKKAINPYERRLIPNSQRYVQAIKGSCCPNCKSEVEYFDYAAGIEKSPYYQCSNYKCRKFLIKDGEQFKLQPEKK